MTDDQWVDLLRHVCFNYDDQGLMLYIVGRIRGEGIPLTALNVVQLGDDDVVTPLEDEPEDAPPRGLCVSAQPPDPPAAMNGDSSIHAIDIDAGTPVTNGHRVLKRTAPRSPVRKGKQRFTDEQVVEFRRRFHVNHVTAAGLAREAGVSDESMRQMIRRDSYAYLPLEPFEPGYEDLQLRTKYDEVEADREARHQARRDRAAGSLYLGEKLHA